MSASPAGDGGAVLDRSAFLLDFDEDFRDVKVDRCRWVAHYLPQWTTSVRSAARFDLRPGMLRLRIDADQPAWRVGDGEMRVPICRPERLLGRSAPRSALTATWPM